jgi:hypothetical protein
MGGAGLSFKPCMSLFTPNTDETSCQHSSRALGYTVDISGIINPNDPEHNLARVGHKYHTAQFIKQPNFRVPRHIVPPQIILLEPKTINQMCWHPNNESPDSFPPDDQSVAQSLASALTFILECMDKHTDAELYLSPSIKESESSSRIAARLTQLYNFQYDLQRLFRFDRAKLYKACLSLSEQGFELGISLDCGN